MLLWTTQESTPKNASADETKSRRAFESSRRLIFVFFLLLSINICSQVSSFGVFQIRFTSLANDRGLDIDGRCCVGGGGGDDDDGVPRGAAGTDGGGGGSSGAAAAAAAAAVVAAEDVCGGPCRTFFTVCLRHFQETLPPTTDVECTFGENATGVVALNSFVESDDTANYTVSIPLDFSWPNSFSLFVKAWHNTTVVGPSKGSSSSSSSSSRTLIAEFAIKRNLSVGEDWRHDLDVGVRVRIGYACRVVCSENFIGPGCSDKCTPRNDKHGHYNCSRNGSKLCLPGWTGEYCLTAICLDGCNTTNGFCDEPFECKCRGGWKGKLCNECKPHPDCRHGNCSDKHQCNCFEGWGGLHCDEDLNYCTNHEPCENGATCKNTGEGSYTCLCPAEFTGTDCETEIFDCHKNVCLNGGDCDMQSDGQHRCLCRKGFSGRRCETSARNCRENPCQNLGTCHSFDDGHLMSYTCHCRPGFTGPTCETDVTVDECASTPCVNGGQCIDEDGGYRCACASGFTGARCEQDVDDDGDCLRDPCLNGGTCSAAADDGRFRCRCSPGFTGDRCREEDVDDCATRPCANGATCVDDGANAFACLCAHGFTGRDCSAKVDECQSRPCRRGTCLDLVNGYRCLCEGGFTGTNCEEKTMGGGGDETTGDSTTTSFDHNSPETDVPPTTDSYLRQVMLVVCLGLLLMLLIICVAVVAFVLQHRRRRRSRRRRSPSGDSKQKMNNAAVDHGDGGDGGGGYYDEKREKSKGGAGHLDVVLKSQQQQQHRSEFAVREQVRVQRNINDATNLKNVEKCTNRKQKVLDWNNAGLSESNAAKSPEHNGRPESKTNIDQTKETNVWKQSDGTLSKRVPSNVICGSQVYLRPEPAVFNGRSIATEV